MTGTEKQIQWATEIQATVATETAEIIAATERCIARRESRGKRVDDIIAALAIVRDTFPRLLAFDDAAWWIDNRNRDVAGLVEQLLVWNTPQAEYGPIVSAVRSTQGNPKYYPAA